VSDHTAAKWTLLRQAEDLRKMGAPASARWFVRAAQALGPLTPEMETHHARLIAWADPLNDKEAAA
jgi:hypothetical protein